jgi:hypothetical protein
MTSNITGIKEESVQSCPILPWWRSWASVKLHITITINGLRVRLTFLYGLTSTDLIMHPTAFNVKSDRLTSLSAAKRKSANFKLLYEWRYRIDKLFRDYITASKLEQSDTPVEKMYTYIHKHIYASSHTHTFIIQWQTKLKSQFKNYTLMGFKFLLLWIIDDTIFNILEEMV